MFESESFLQLKFDRKTFATRPISFWSKMVPSIQVESKVLTVDEVERIQRQKIATVLSAMCSIHETHNYDWTVKNLSFA